jgi:hypothetical protein
MFHVHIPLPSAKWLHGATEIYICVNQSVFFSVVSCRTCVRGVRVLWDIDVGHVCINVISSNAEVVANCSQQYAYDLVEVDCLGSQEMLAVVEQRSARC